VNGSTVPFGSSSYDVLCSYCGETVQDSRESDPFVARVRSLAGRGHALVVTNPLVHSMAVEPAKACVRGLFVGSTW
jgi:hypothetical protein